MGKIEKISAPRGMPDTLPGDMPLLRRIEETAHRVFRIYGYEEIRTPMFEETRLFVRGIGEATDIVEKEMYTFADAGRDPAASGDSITLRPEGTAPVVRAVVEHELLKQQGFWKLYYVGPMFRKERPQAGRLRQFEQIGCEAVGSGEPAVDAESILLAARFFNEVGLPGVQVKINTIGCPNCRAAYRDGAARTPGAAPRRNSARTAESRFDRNVFRVLDCKNPACREIARAAPPMRDHLDADCRAHFEAVTALADARRPRVQSGRSPRARVRLLHADGVRAFAFRPGRARRGLRRRAVRQPRRRTRRAAGRLRRVRRGRRSDDPGAPEAEPRPGARSRPPARTLISIAVNDEVRTEIFRMTEKLRAAGIRAEMDYERRSLKAQMRSANKCRARYAIVVGPDELAAGKLKLKEMATGEERTPGRSRGEMPISHPRDENTDRIGRAELWISRFTAIVSPRKDCRDKETEWSARGARTPAGN